MFILPNRETFFDLILLEVMSMGIPVLLSNTGGNKYFKRFGNRGIILYKNESDAVEKILALQSENRKCLYEWGRENETIFDRFFDEKVFAGAYLNFIEEILDEKK